ncbi:carbamoyltransferase [Nocardia sp. NPDC101769]|uniref:carbamoyltransferase family protein n=1 Tax=Nocardia sp. NPDC101769 TaxID=3364333 RepID=UPI00382640D1
MGYVLGLGGPYHHDAAACLVGDGRVLAFAEEERFSRIKHHRDSRSAAQSAAWCLRQSGIGWADIDDVAVAWNPYWPNYCDRIGDAELIAELLGPDARAAGAPRRLTVIGHHLAHAASAFYPAGVTEAAVLVVDGSGDGVSTSIHHGSPVGLRTVRELPYTQSLGWMYQNATTHVGLGDWTNAGKLMGLAAYGQPRIELPFLHLTDDGYHLDLTRYGLPPFLGADATSRYTDFSYYRDLKLAYAKAFTDAGVPAQPPGGHHPDRMAVDLATSVQAALQQAMLALATNALTLTGTATLCVAGGVALNCTSNGILARTPAIADLFVQPAASDAGCALGAALECARRRGDFTVPGPRQAHTLLGPEYSHAAIETALAAAGARYSTPDDIAAAAAHRIAAGQVVGWFQGRAEAGPRALGARSILADPRSTTLRDHVNRDVKRREMWRPLAPSMLDLTSWTTTPHGPAEAMIVAHHATDTAHEQIPGVVHVDGTLRPQRVDPQIQPTYARLLREIQAETGHAVVLNTSFNGPGEPIVATPADALASGARLGLDALAIGDYLVDLTASNTTR